MVQLLQDDFDLLADAYAFIGNSLLKPMSMTEAVGLDAAFWEAFPDFEDEGVSVAKEELIEWADTQTDKDSGQAVEDVSVEYTRLFIGPPSPAAAPWETMYGEVPDGEKITVGFGTPTFQMRQLLRARGFELSNENHQYEDHIGIELLYLSELCRDIAKADEGSSEYDEALLRVKRFAAEHPLKWIGDLKENVASAFPEGYIVRLLTLATACLKLNA